MKKETVEKIKKFLYRELEKDSSNVEINELLDELELPDEVILTEEGNGFRLSDEFVNSVNEYLSDEYGHCNGGWNVEIKISNIDWEKGE